jgi:hypothetical protein
VEYTVSWDSSVGIATKLWAGQQKSWGLTPGRGKRFFLFSVTSRLALGPTQPPVQWVLEAVSPRVKQQGHEADHSSPSSAMVKNGGATPPLPHGTAGA